MNTFALFNNTIFKQAFHFSIKLIDRLKHVKIIMKMNKKY